MNDSVFSPRLLAAWVAAAVVVFAITLYFMGGGEFTTPEGYGPTTYSRSAIGHAGIAEVLLRHNIPVVKSRADTLSKLTPGSVLVVAEPNFGFTETVPKLLKANTVLLVLPKRIGAPSVDKPGWIRQVADIGTGAPQSLLKLVASDATVVRPVSQIVWATNILGITPNVATPYQLIRGDQLTPVIGNSEGLLLGEVTEQNRRIWILADPDVISNHGLARPGNAELAVAIFDRLRRGNGAVVFDETIHGYIGKSENPLLLMFRFPFVVATAQAAVAVALLLWATMARFGAPQPPPPALSVGRLGLLQNVAKLIEFTGHQQIIVRRYVQETLRDTARQLHAPATLSGEQLIAWLRRVGTVRHVELDCGEIAKRAENLRDPAGQVRIARDIYQWKQEMVDGRSRNPRAH